MKRIADTEIFTSAAESTFEAFRVPRPLERKDRDKTEGPVPHRPPTEEEDASSRIPEDSVDFGGGTEVGSPTEEQAQDGDSRQEEQAETIVSTDPEELRVHLKEMHEHLLPCVQTPPLGSGKNFPWGSCMLRAGYLLSTKDNYTF